MLAFAVDLFNLKEIEIISNYAFIKGDIRDSYLV